MSEQTAKQIIEELKKKYKDDSNALDELARAEKDIEYIEKREKSGNYNGQTSIGYAKMIAADLEYWN